MACCGKHNHSKHDNLNNQKTHAEVHDSKAKKDDHSDHPEKEKTHHCKC